MLNWIYYKISSNKISGNNFIIQNIFLGTTVNRLGILTSLPLHSSFHICVDTKHRLISFQPTFDSPLWCPQLCDDEYSLTNNGFGSIKFRYSLLACTLSLLSFGLPMFWNNFNVQHITTLNWKILNNNNTAFFVPAFFYWFCKNSK